MPAAAATDSSRIVAFALAVIGQDEIAEVVDTLESGWLSTGPRVAALPLRLPAPVADDDVHARHLYTVCVDEPAAGMSRDDLQPRLRKRGIATSIHFRTLHLHRYYQDRFALRRGMFPAAEAISDTTLSLPLSGGMTTAAAEQVIEALHDILR